MICSVNALKKSVLKLVVPISFFFFVEALTEEEKEKLAKIKKKMKRKVCWQVVCNTELLVRMQL